MGIRHITCVQNLRQSKAYLFLILGIGLVLLIWQRLDREKLVVYCAHDAVFAEEILRDFTRQTGVEVVVKYDTEATKSLGLVEQIIQDGSKPRCDVFWNNELLGTLDLAERGLVESYKGTGWQRIPERWRDPDGKWAGFAARLRVKIVNTEHPGYFEAAPNEGGTTLVETAGPPGSEPAPPAERRFERFAIAKPLYGTTLTHYTVLWKQWGPERLKFWHGETRARGLREANGNAGVKDLVVGGTCGAGYTDTDDYFEAKDAGKPVTASPVKLEDGATICIPNTVVIIHGTKRLSDAQKLADFLLSARAELTLAKSKSRQIPLGALDEAQRSQVPAEVRELAPEAERGYPLGDLLKARNECLAWLKSAYLK
jgi:iron(III) transport system substrate-binding protein